MSDRIQILDVDPTPAPRQSRRDKFKPSKAVVNYRRFRDQVASQIDELPADFFHAVFLLPVWPSWSKKKQREHVGHPHLAKPDKDNLEKALVDAVYRDRDDSHIWNSTSTKLWSYYGAIIILDDYFEILELPVDIGALIRGSWEVFDRDRTV